MEVTVKGTKAAHVSLSPQTNENPEISSKERPKSVDWSVRGYTDIDESVLGGGCMNCTIHLTGHV